MNTGRPNGTPSTTSTMGLFSSSSSSAVINSQYKLVLLGDSAVGKSSLVLRFARKKFFEEQESTIGAAFSTQTVSLPGRLVKYDIWDTAGQERYFALAPLYYRGADAVIVVYDVTNRQSFIRAKSWVSELKRQNNHNIVISLAGNKLDLADGNRQITSEEAQLYAKENDLLFIETSAKTNHGVSEMFQAITEKLILQKAPRPVNSTTVDLHGEDIKRTGCCL